MRTAATAILIIVMTIMAIYYLYITRKSYFIARNDKNIYMCVCVSYVNVYRKYVLRCN